jgi:hypothetical protein
MINEVIDKHHRTIETSSVIENDTIKLNYNDIFIAKDKSPKLTNNNNNNNNNNYSRHYESDTNHKKSKNSYADSNPYFPIGRNVVKSNLSINILDEQSSMISYNDESRSMKQKMQNQYSVDSEP